MPRIPAGPACHHHVSAAFLIWQVLHLGEKALKKLDSAEVSKEVEDLVSAAQEAVEGFPSSEQLAKVDAVVAELQVSMLDFLKMEEKRKARRAREKERMERLKAEGKILSKAERERREKNAAYLGGHLCWAARRGGPSGSAR